MDAEKAVPLAVREVTVPVDAPGPPVPVQDPDDPLKMVMPPAYGQVNIRYNRDPAEHALIQERMETSWQHANPYSVYVAAMGNHWKGRAWAHVADMVHHTNQHGFRCVLDELQDRCFQPYDSLGVMRNEGILRARQGYEFVCYLDNDVLPEPDLLVRLLRRNVSIVAPYVTEPEIGRPLHGPDRQRWTGLQPIRWCVLSMLVFRTTVFNATGPAFWDSPLGADEGYHFQRLYDVGHSPLLDTDNALQVQKRPTYPLATNRWEKAQADAYWNERREWLLSEPDRSPHNPADPRVQDGNYLPFLPVPVPAQATGFDAVPVPAPEPVPLPPELMVT